VDAANVHDPRVELANKVVVITGGASGIGRAMANRFAEEGSAGVVVADLNGDGARAVAGDIGADIAAGIGCDVSREEDLRSVLALAEERFGPVDVFCANAGVGDAASEQAPDELWDLAFAVNVRAHVLAARVLVPEWLERGSGCFLATASAAGLLTQIGSAPYSVTKHAAVAFAEWLSVTYGDRGIHVSCLCPMGVNTNMLQAGETAEGEALPTAVVKLAGNVLEPEQVADVVVAGLRDERFLILPHPEVLTFLQRKAMDEDRWLAGMRRLQADLVKGG
jgi:NAD(P)-dependent dehydrogenase (short-subunit alcohol dehydrogenase family)